MFSAPSGSGFWPVADGNHILAAENVRRVVLKIKKKIVRKIPFDDSQIRAKIQNNGGLLTV